MLPKNKNNNRAKGRSRKSGPSRPRGNSGPVDKRNPSQMLIPRPPPIPNYNIKHSTILRFVSNVAVNQAITVSDLTDLIVIAATAVAGYDLFQFVKIRRINLWCLGALGSSEFLSLTFNGTGGSSYGDNKIYTSSSMGIQPACISAVPSMRSLISNFQPSGIGSTAFTIDIPSGTVIDVHLTYLATFSGAPTPAQNALVGATVGAIYLRGLDGLASAASKLPPVLIQDEI